jgi:hypothetical protein
MPGGETASVPSATTAPATGGLKETCLLLTGDFRHDDCFIILSPSIQSLTIRHQPANAGKVVFPREMWPMSNDRQLPSEIETCLEVERRNRLRREFGLPPVELQPELDRVRRVRECRAFQQWMRSPLRYRVEQKLLQRQRRRRNDSTWRPTGFLSGGGWGFHAKLVEQIRKLRKRLGG